MTTSTPGHPILDWSYEEHEGEDLPVVPKLARKLAGPLPLVIPYRASSRPWVAEITGRDDVYRYARIFVEPTRSQCGRTYSMVPGRMYEVNDGQGDRYFIVPPKFEGDEQLTLTSDEADFFLHP